MTSGITPFPNKVTFAGVELRLQHGSQGAGTQFTCKSPLSPLSFTGCFCGFFSDIPLPPTTTVTLIISWDPLEWETLSWSGLSQLLFISPPPILGPLVNVLEAMSSSSLT